MKTAPSSTTTAIRTGADYIQSLRGRGQAS